MEDRQSKKEARSLRAKEMRIVLRQQRGTEKISGSLAQ
jgi:hypothetical protein